MKQQSLLLKDRDQWLVYSEWTGLLEDQGVDDWIQSINQAIEMIPQNSIFQLVICMTHLSPVNQDVHQYFKNALSVLLMNYGLYPVTSQFMPTSTTEQATVRGIVCEGIAFQYQETGIHNAHFWSQAYFHHSLDQLNWQAQ